MDDATKEIMGQPTRHTVSFKALLLHDITSYLAGILYLFMILCVGAIYIAVGWFDARPPKESPGEVFFGLLLVSVIVFIVLRIRVSHIAAVLDHGEIVTAEVLRGLHYQTFAQILLRYSLHGVITEKKIWLPNTRRPRGLIQEKQLVLSIPRNSPDTIVVRDLYPQPPGIDRDR